MRVANGRRLKADGKDQDRVVVDVGDADGDSALLLCARARLGAHARHARACMRARTLWARRAHMHAERSKPVR